MKNLIKAMLAISALCLAACSNEPDDAPLKRDTDQVTVAYRTAATTKFSVRYSGSWDARVECLDADGAPSPDWFAISPDNGVGDGNDYQYITVTASRNGGAARKGYVYLRTQGDAEEKRVEITQEAGIFKFEAPKVVGELKTSIASAAQLVIDYDKAFGGEIVEIEAVLEGAGAEGLSIEPKYSKVIEAEGSGQIELPITGMPQVMGELVCLVVAKLNGTEVYNGKISVPVKSPNEILTMGFDAFKWGGDYPHNKSGVGPDASIPKLQLTGNEDSPAVITSGTDGASDMFNPTSMSDVYRKNRGVTGWTGQRVYEHPGYVKLGVTGNGGWIMTPPLQALGSTPSTVVVSIDFMRFDKEEGTYIVSAEGAGVVMNGEVSAAVVPASVNAAGRKWTTVAFTVKEATNQTQIKLCAADLTITGCRMNIDNFIVMSKSKPVIKDPLDMPDMSTLIMKATESSFDLKWDAVKNADAYDVELTDVTRPQFSIKKRVETPDVKIENILPGYYELKLTAVWADDAKLNSETAVKQIVTHGVRTEPLDAPTNLGCTNKGYTMTATWSASDGATGYEAILLDGQTEVGKAEVSTTSCDFESLVGNKTYTLKVKALFKPNSTLNSEYATKELQSLPGMTAPSLAILQKTDYKIVFEWGLSDAALAERAIIGSDNKGKSDVYDFVLCNASGQEIAGRKFEDYNYFNFTKYRKLRFVYSGLTASTTYQVKIRRKMGADVDTKYVDSEWVSRTVTTDAAKNTSDYKVWIDFGKHYFGGEGPLCGYGTMFDAASTSFANLGDITYKAPDKNYIFVPSSFVSSVTDGKVTAASYTATDYHKIFASQWADQTYLVDNSRLVYMAPGFVKFGKGNYGGRLVMPQLTSLATPANVTLTFDACPYYEPYGTGGELGDAAHAPAVQGSRYVWVRVEGATVTEWDGKTGSETDVRLDNNTYLDMKDGKDASTLGYYAFTSHTVKISGASKDTKIYIYTSTFDPNGAADCKNVTVNGETVDGRIWLTNIGLR